MPRGPVIFSLPPGTTPQQPNDVIQSAVWNSAMDDIANTFNTIQPVEYGGTGSATAAGALTNLGALPVAGGTTTGLVNIGLTGSNEKVRFYVNGNISGTFYGLEGTVVYGWIFDRAAGTHSLRYGATVAAALAAPPIVVMNATGAMEFGRPDGTSNEHVIDYVAGNVSGTFYGFAGTVLHGWVFDRGAGTFTLRKGASIAAALAAAPLLTLSATGSLAVANNLTVSGTTTLTGATALNGGAAVTGTLSATGLTTLSAGANVTGAVSVTGTLGATGLATLGAGANVTGTLAVTGAGSYSTNLTVGGTTTVTGATSLNGGAAVTGTLSASGLTTLSAGANVTGTLAVTGAGTFTGNVTALPGLMYGRGNILGTVSQSAGVPTGAVVENGSGGTGSYVRFADGTQICRNTVTFVGTPITLLSGGIYYAPIDGARAFPAAFVAVPQTAIEITAGGSAVFVGRAGNDTSTAWGTWYPFADISKTVTVVAHFTAIGRWF